MSEVFFQREAAREYRAARKWYAARSPRAAERFRMAVAAAVDRITALGESLPVVQRPYHVVRVKRFPYVLIFRRGISREFRVVAVAHTSRRPGYWHGRH